MDRTSLASRFVTGRSSSAAPGHERLQIGLAVDRDRVVDERPDAAVRERRRDVVPLAGEPHRVLVPDVLAALGHGGGQVAVEPLGQAVGVLAALRGPLVEAGQLGKPQRGGEVRGLRVRAQRLVVVADAHPVVPVQADPVGQAVVVGRGEATLAGHQVLGRVQAEHRRPELPGAAAAVRRAVRLGGVLDDRDPAALRDLHQRVHVGHQAVQVDRHDRLRAGRDRGLDPVGIEAEVVGPDVHEHGSGAGLEDRADRRVEREADRDHLVARADPERPQDRHQGDGAVGHEHGVPHAAVRGPRLLELRRPATHREHAGAEDVDDGLFFGRPEVGLRDRDHAGTSVVRGTQRSLSMS